MTRHSFLDLAVSVQGVIALGMTMVLGGAFLTRHRYWHRVPALVTLFAFIGFTLKNLVDGVYVEEWRVKVLGCIYALAIVAVSLIASWISQERDREKRMRSGEWDAYFEGSPPGKDKRP